MVALMGLSIHWLLLLEELLQVLRHLVLIGMSVVIGNGIGMGLGDYLSAKSEKQFILAEEQRELWEVNKLEAEKAEIVEIYTEKEYTLE